MAGGWASEEEIQRVEDELRGAIVNVAAGDSTAGLILRQKKLLERYEAALEMIAEPYRNPDWNVRTPTFSDASAIAREALGEQATT